MPNPNVRKCVLWIDDEPYTLKTLQLMLQERGVIVDCASSIQEAKDRLIEKNYDSIILDCMMAPCSESTPPKYAGVAFLKNLRRGDIRNMPQIMSVPVIAITGVADTSVLQALREQGVSDVLYKPVLVEEIFESLISVLGP